MLLRRATDREQKLLECTSRGVGGLEKIEIFTIVLKLDRGTVTRYMGFMYDQTPRVLLLLLSATIWSLMLKHGTVFSAKPMQQCV